MNLTILVLLCTLSGCATSFMSQAPMARSVTLPGTPQDAYVRATVAYAQLGGQPAMLDPQARVISGTVHGAVQLNVRVDPDSTVHVTGHVLPGKFALGRFTEVEDYVALLQEAPHGR